MKFIFILISGAIVGVLFYFGGKVHSAQRDCNIRYQDSVETLVIQSHAVFANKDDLCRNSYELINEWDLCLSESTVETPEVIKRYIDVAVSQYMLFFREKKKDITALKREHDERCVGVPDFMFSTAEGL